MVKIISTIGPSSIKVQILEKLKSSHVNYVRINLSHTKTQEIEEKILQLKKSNLPIILDTEGSQIRTGYLGKSCVVYNESDKVKIYNHQVPCDNTKIFLRPENVVKFLEPGTLISIDFDSVLLKVEDYFNEENKCVNATVLIGGVVGNNKAVTVDQDNIQLEPFSKKDLIAIELGKKHNIKHFTLSFIDHGNEVLKFKEIYPNAIAYAKVETKKGVENLDSIINAANGVLIDRGDLSREIPIERIPLTQKIIIKKCNKANKEVFVATNILESMSDSLKPTRAEVNDVVNTVLDGVTGLVLTKETAVGNNPIETIHMLHTLINHAKLALDAKEILTTSNEDKVISRLEELNYITGPEIIRKLNTPHGGKLINREISNEDKQKLNFQTMEKLEVDETILMDSEQIAIGTFSPLEGFLDKENFISVLDNMCLKNGTIWPLPIYLQVNEKKANNFTNSQEILLVSNKDKQAYATLKINQIYELDLNEVAIKLFGTNNQEHPGVKKLLTSGNKFIGGKISLIKRLKSPYKQYESTPRQVRKIFEEKGWRKIIGFHTRNAIHRSHEFIQLEGMKRSHSDGLFINPVIGKKKKGDFKSSIIIKSYEMMMNNFYPKNKVVFSTFSTYSRYCGPREAVFTAICRKNFGCSHFVIGRDHTGVGKFYGAKDSHKIFDKFPNLGIGIIKFNNVSYSNEIENYVEDNLIKEDQINQQTQNLQSNINLTTNNYHISGTQARMMFKNKQQPPKWFMRPEISKMIIDEINSGNQIFFE